MSQIDADVLREAAERSHNNRFSRTNDPLNDNAEILGVLGERAFCRDMGLDWDQERPKGRHEGYQFVINGAKIKTYTPSQPGYALLVKQGRVNADIYVLCYSDNGSAWLAGWANKTMVENAPIVFPKHDGAYKMASHRLPANLLQTDFDGLRQVLGLRSNGHLTMLPF